jgi:hypothetical protein
VASSRGAVGRTIGSQSHVQGFESCSEKREEKDREMLAAIKRVVAIERLNEKESNKAIAFGATTISIMTLSLMTFSILTPSITAFSVMTLSITAFIVMTVNIQCNDTQHNSIHCNDSQHSV